MKFSTKQITTFVVSFLIMLMCFAIFVLFFNDATTDKVQYIVDDINVCTWEGEVITQATEAFDTELSLEDVIESEEEAFLANAAADSRCIAKLGDRAGFYATQLNEQYQAQLNQ